MAKAKGGSGRSYKRDANGRFASTGGGGSKASKPKAQKAAAAPKKTSKKRDTGLDVSAASQRKTSVGIGKQMRAEAEARLSEGRKLRGKAKTQTGRLSRVMESGLLKGGKKGRKSVATAMKAAEYLQKQSTGGKKARKRK